LRQKKIDEMPVLQFRNGLEIATVKGGYAGYYLLFPEIFLSHCYQPTSNFVIRDTWVILDVGANMGFFTCQAASAANNVRVIAVEPVADYVEKIHENIIRNHLQNVEVIHAAIADKPNTSIPITIWYTKSGEPKVTTIIPPNAPTSTETVKGLTMNEIFIRGKITNCNLLKMDIEGAEYSIFDTTPPEIWAKIERIIMETHQTEYRSPVDLERILQDQGFIVKTKKKLLWAIRPELQNK
jgi:FkbM family methyltransferase